MDERDLHLMQGILFTDMYQLTMAQVYFEAGIHERPAHFDHFFRSYPNYGDHKAGYCIAAGLDWLLDWMENASFDQPALDHLARERDIEGRPVFKEEFLHWLSREGNFKKLKLQAIAEGRVVHPNVPLTTVEGPLAMAQILETALLNSLNFQTLIATKAARIRHSCGSRLLMEFGLRRAHGWGGNQASRAALIGGCDYSSNAGLSFVMDVPPKGTHSHALVQAWMAMGRSELEAFQAYADLYPDSCLLLVDTVDTLNSGVPNAIRVFRELRRKGYEPLGVRLDSGDLAYLSIQVSKMLDDAGFPQASIVLSNDLDEMTILQIHAQIRDDSERNGVNAEHVIRRLTYGVGTRLVTSAGQSSLGGVYKLVALQVGGEWKPAMKYSNSVTKLINPGHKKAWRIYDNRDRATADLIGFSDEDPASQETLTLHHPAIQGVSRTLKRSDISRIEPLLETVWEGGGRRQPRPTLEELRTRCREDLNHLDTGVLRMRSPHIYHISLTPRLLEAKLQLIAKVHKLREG